MSKFENLFMSLVLGLTVSFGVVAPANAQEQESIGVSEVVEHVASNTTDTVAPPQSQEATPVEALAEGAARLIALASSNNLSTGTPSVNRMCPLFRGCYKRSCGVSSMLKHP